MPRMLRVAAAQCEVHGDVAANIATLADMIGQAADAGARLVVLPEFGNHYSVYDSEQHAWDVAIDTSDPEDDFVSAISRAAARHDIWVVANSTVRRSGPGDIEGCRRMTVTQMLFSPTDGLVAEGDKQVLMGAERTYLSGSNTPGTVVDTPLARIGLYCCMDGVINEPARSLAVRGAEILCNSLNSFALDEAALHVPSRAAENGVWVVACCKVGALLPEARRSEFARVVELPEDTFTAAGESQIVSPDGVAIQMGPRSGAAVVVGDIDLDEMSDHRRPDGTSLLGFRRPELYAPVATDVAPLPAGTAGSVEVAVVQQNCGDITALAARVGELARDGVELVVLPELAAHTHATLEEDPANAARSGELLVAALQEAIAGTDCVVVTSVVETEDVGAHPGPSFAHVGLALTAGGVALHQPALHRPERHARWQEVLGDRVKVLATPFGRLSVLTSDDLLVPEAARLAVLGGAEVVASPFDVAEASDLSLVVPQRCAENRVCLAVASRPGEFGGGAAFDPPENPVWSRPDRPAPFDRTINDPDRHLCAPEQPAMRVALHPSRTVEKLVTTDTDLVYGRRPELRSDLVTEASD